MHSTDTTETLTCSRRLCECACARLRWSYARWANNNQWANFGAFSTGMETNSDIHVSPTFSKTATVESNLPRAITKMMPVRIDCPPVDRFSVYHVFRVPSVVTRVIHSRWCENLPFSSRSTTSYAALNVSPYQSLRDRSSCNRFGKIDRDEDDGWFVASRVNFAGFALNSKSKTDSAKSRISDSPRKRICRLSLLLWGRDAARSPWMIKIMGRTYVSSPLLPLDKTPFSRSRPFPSRVVPLSFCAPAVSSWRDAIADKVTLHVAAGWWFTSGTKRYFLRSEKTLWRSVLKMWASDERKQERNLTFQKKRKQI